MSFFYRSDYNKKFKLKYLRINCINISTTMFCSYVVVMIKCELFTELFSIVMITLILLIPYSARDVSLAFHIV